VTSAVPAAEPVDGAGGADFEPLAPLLELREGVPPLVATAPALGATVAAMAAGSGPVAIDAERASGYRYGQRAYLVQLRRAGAGTALVDPVHCPDLSELGRVIADAEWVLHAAGQDLPCLAELGLRPRVLFDTELAGRLAGFPRVSLGAMVEVVLGHRLEKAHSAGDWSQRPLPEPWLRYAALDVEVLVELRDALEVELRRQGKLGYAREEFAAVAAAPPPRPRAEPWRRTAGIHRLRNRRQLAAVRELWQARDALARDSDVAPGRVLPDTAVIAAALAAPADAAALRELPLFRGRGTRRHTATWLAALQRAGSLADSALPPSASGTRDGGPPGTNRWADRDPLAAARLAAVRGAVAALAELHRIPAENLLPPEAVRQLAWAPPTSLDPTTVAAALLGSGARDWQVDLTAANIAAALTHPDPGEV